MLVFNYHQAAIIIDADQQLHPTRRIEQPVPSFPAYFESKLDVEHCDIHQRSVEVKCLELEWGVVGGTECGKEIQLCKRITNDGLLSPGWNRLS